MTTLAIVLFMATPGGPLLTPNVKVVLLGAVNTGKSCMADRFLHHKFSDMEKKATVGAAFVSKRIQATHEKTVCIGLWDTAGSEVYKAMSRLYYRDAKAAVVCYDITDTNSFQNAQFWINELREVELGCRLYLCATKQDLLAIDAVTHRENRAVALHDIDLLVAKINAKYFETSSKTGYAIDDLFHQIAADFATDPANEPLFNPNSIKKDHIQLTQPPPNDSRSYSQRCCN